MEYRVFEKGCTGCMDLPDCILDLVHPEDEYCSLFSRICIGILYVDSYIAEHLCDLVKPAGLVLHLDRNNVGKGDVVPEG